jgi:trehalose 6-phosphate phosphatase
LSDIDGTLAPIVPRPEDARVIDRARESLGALVAKGVRVALITGRTLEMARKMVGLEGVSYAANHGLELWVDGDGETTQEATEYSFLARQAIRDLEGLGTPGVEVEDKGPVIGVHYRRAVDGESARRMILGAIARSSAASQFRVHEGRKVVELRPAVAVDKGTAAVALMRRLGARGVVCVGDDTTDLDMFGVVRRMREEGLGGMTVAVRSEEATSDLMEGADYWVDGVEGVEWLLAEMVRGLRGRRREDPGADDQARR